MLGHPVRLGVPVDPEAAEARRWAEEELAKAVYSDEPSLLERALAWFLRLFEGIGEIGLSAPPAVVPVLVVLAFVAVLVLALVVGGRVRRNRAVAGAASTELFEDDRSSAELARTADDAARRGDWATAVLERFRALIRGLDERAVLDDRPGLTAHEAAGLAAAALPEVADGLRWAGRLFDDVRYGHVAPGAAEDEDLRELVARVDRARPAPAGVGADGWAGVS
ncbi:DUF4129 domain-containing protein [Georgenia subflava]|uniref:DUF4129 domain-containing protein n=1 Tax=Georgenia subflava TaxID=1622177 RepID=A0A6N7EL23_9MICO|nr:DUF4129 domain-containing protein [Georgenia subflava]MPV37788.1 DUF4129 domain-containing protein [Georgenia subflava]